MRLITIVVVSAALSAGITSISRCSADVSTDNDVLAFEFISSAPSPVYVAIDKCYDFGIYTIEELERVGGDPRINDYTVDKTKTREVTCEEMSTLFGAYDE